jgi:hypothetical protein
MIPIIIPFIGTTPIVVPFTHRGIIHIGITILPMTAGTVIMGIGETVDGVGAIRRYQ